MSTGVFLVNGAGLPYHVIDRAIDWAEKNQAPLIGVFIFSDQKNAENYGFPSDIEEAETLVSEQEGEKDIAQLISGNMQYAQKQAAAKGISVHTTSLKDPGSNELLAELQKGNLLFADPETFKGADEYASTSFSFEDIVLLAPEIIEVRN